MVSERLIPILLLRGGRCVKGVNFQDHRDTGSPATAARVYDAQGADELIFLDIEATTSGRGALLDVVERTADNCFMPLTVGGGVRTTDDIRKLLRAGADKVSINTAAIAQPNFVREASTRFGAQCIVVAIDASRRHDGSYEVFSHCGQRQTGVDAIEWAKRAADLGAGEILVTSIDREGTRRGYDIELIRSVSTSVPVPVIANGGVGNLDHFVEGIRDGKASAVAAGSIFHFTDQNLIKTRSHLRNAGLNVRRL